MRVFWAGLADTGLVFGIIRLSDVLFGPPEHPYIGMLTGGLGFLLCQFIASRCLR